MTIAIDDIKKHYVTIAEARRMSGLRIVLGAFTIPGPWHEACKGIFHVKGLAYTPVRSANANASDLQIGMDGSQSELIEWTAQSSAPVVVWNDERPRSLFDAQLAGQHARGHRYLVGEALTALDIYWAASCGFLDSMPEDRCPMCTDFRAPNLYGTPNDAIERALTPSLRAHRDFVYEQHLELPIVF